MSQQVAFQVYMTSISPQLNNDIFTLYIIFPSLILSLIGTLSLES